MKKVLLFVGVVGMIGMTSCKKEYTCECRDSDGDISSTGTITAKKSDAETWCENFAFTTETCELK